MHIRSARPVIFLNSDHADSLPGLPSKAVVAIFGAGERGLDVARQLRLDRPDIRLAFFIDNGKTGSTRGHPIISFEAFRENTDAVDAVIIASYWHKDMAAQLDSINYSAYLFAEPNKLARSHGERNPDMRPISVQEISHTENGCTIRFQRNDPNVTGIDYRLGNDATNPADNDVICLARKKGGRFPSLRVAAVFGEKRSPWIPISLRTIPTSFKGLNATVKSMCVDTEYQQTVVADIGPLAFQPQSWAEPSPPLSDAADMAFARDRWGKLIDNNLDDYENVAAIGRDIIVSLASRPPKRVDMNEELLLHPFQRLEMVQKGKALAYCGHYAAILDAACRSFNFPARTIALANYWDQGKTRIQIGLTHVANEIYCRKREQWIWVDLNSRALGAVVNETIHLSAMEFISFAHSSRAKDLYIIEIDPATGRREVIPFVDSYVGNNLHELYHRDHMVSLIY